MAVQHNIVSLAFLPFNRTYPIRFEAVSVLWSTVASLALLPPASPAVVAVTRALSSIVVRANLVADERMRLWSFKDRVLQVRCMCCLCASLV